MVLWGMNVGDAERLLLDLERGCSELACIQASLDGLLRDTAWEGADAHAFRSEWQSAHSAAMAAAQQAIVDFADSMRHQMAEQLEASAIKTGAADVGLSHFAQSAVNRLRESTHDLNVWNGLMLASTLLGFRGPPTTVDESWLYTLKGQASFLKGAEGRASYEIRRMSDGRWFVTESLGFGSKVSAGVGGEAAVTWGDDMLGASAIAEVSLYSGSGMGRTYSASNLTDAQQLISRLVLDRSAPVTSGVLDQAASPLSGLPKVGGFLEKYLEVPDAQETVSYTQTTASARGRLAYGDIFLKEGADGVELDFDTTKVSVDANIDLTSGIVRNESGRSGERLILSGDALAQWYQSSNGDPQGPNEKFVLQIDRYEPSPMGEEPEVIIKAVTMDQDHSTVRTTTLGGSSAEGRSASAAISAMKGEGHLVSQNLLELATKDAALDSVAQQYSEYERSADDYGVAFNAEFLAKFGGEVTLTIDHQKKKL